MIDKKSSKKIDFGKNFQITNCWKSNSMPNGYKLNRVNSEWTIAVITSGNMKLNNSGQILTENDIIIFPPNEKQDIVYTNNACSFWINFVGDNIEKILEQLGIPSLTICSITTPETISIIERIINEHLLKNLYYSEIAISNMKSFFYMLSREFTIKISVNQNLIKNVVLAMYSNPHISNEECAKLCLMSKDHFIRIFKMAYGVTPLQFKKKIILSRAKNLLLKTNLSITSIAESSGFVEYPLYFNKFFKDATGYYPSRYRELFSQTPQNDTSPQKKQIKKSKNSN